MIVASSASAPPLHAQYNPEDILRQKRQIQKMQEEGRRNDEYMRQQNAARQAAQNATAEQTASRFRWTPDLFASFDRMAAHINALPPTQDSLDELKELRRVYMKIKDPNLSSTENFVRSNDIYSLIGKQEAKLTIQARTAVAKSLDDVRAEGEQRAAANEDNLSGVPDRIARLEIQAPEQFLTVRELLGYAITGPFGGTLNFEPTPCTGECYTMSFSDTAITFRHVGDHMVPVSVSDSHGATPLNVNQSSGRNGFMLLATNLCALPDMKTNLGQPSNINVIPNLGQLLQNEMQKIQRGE